MGNTVIRHYGPVEGASIRRTLHLVTSHRCRLTLDWALVTCAECQATGGRTTAPDDLRSRIQPTVTFGNEESA